MSCPRLCPLVRDGVTLIHAYAYFSSSPALSLRRFLLSFNFPHMLRIALARCAVYPSLICFHYRYRDLLGSFSLGFPFPLGISLAFLAHPSAL